MSNPKKAPVRRKVNGYKMPAHIPKGQILKDTHQNEWKLGPSIGKGGFGEIYSAKQLNSKSNDYDYVVKIEPHENGPLFVEMHFYTRNAKKEDVTAFMKSKKLKTLGMPIFIASGSHTYNDEKYRFLVMEKFSTDIWKLFLKNNKKMPAVTVYKLGIQMLDALEYVHSRGYVHADLKGANILLKDDQQAYLVDFGLTSKFTSDAVFKPNPKRAHDGTIEYLSRDAHQGVPTRRGDIEILAFNMIHWLCGKLPWESKLTDPVFVQNSKQDNMKNINKFMNFCFEKDIPSAIVDLLQYIVQMKFNDAPKYDKIKQILLDGLHASGGTESSPLKFTTANKRGSTSIEKEITPQKRAKAQKASETPTPVVAENGKDTQNGKPGEENPGADVKENISSKKVKAAKRTRRINTISTVDDVKDTVEVPMNAEMLKFQKIVDTKNQTSSAKTKKTAKLNRSLDAIIDVDEDDSTNRPMTRAAARRLQLQV